MLHYALFVLDVPTSEMFMTASDYRLILTSTLEVKLPLEMDSSLNHNIKFKIKQRLTVVEFLDHIHFSKF